MNIYENIIILNASLSDEEIETASTKVKDLITNSGGEILKAEPWGRRKLAYEIKKHKKGFYLFLVFKSDAAFIKKLEEFYKVYDPIVKFMVIRLDKKMLKSFAKAEEAAAAKAEAQTAEAAAAPVKSEA